MEISANQVRELREKTGRCMMDCKKALLETSGNLEKAVDYLGKKGLHPLLKKRAEPLKTGLLLLLFILMVNLEFFLK